MMKKIVICATVLFCAVASLIILQKPALSAGACPVPNINTYTSYPPFISTASTPPSVMLVLDNSGSMFQLAYTDGVNPCTVTYCTDFTAGGTFTYPNQKYYGYFDPDYWYTYDPGDKKFMPTTDPKTLSGLPGNRAKNANEWDGNFLNWVTMRRMDVMRKVLTGGKLDDKDNLITAAADFFQRGYLKKTTNAALYTPYSTTGEAYFKMAFGVSDPSGFEVSETPVFPVTPDPFNSFDVRVDTVVGTVPAGIVQNTWTTIRWGLSYYHPNTPIPHGGFVEASVNKESMNKFIEKINNKDPDSNTPLAETLWTTVGYFAQSDTLGFGAPGPMYNSDDYKIRNEDDPMNYGTKDNPQYLSCGKSIVLYVTDGEPCGDGNLPAGLRDYAGTQGSVYNCQGISCPAVGGFPASTIPSCGVGGNIAGIEDVALYAHTNDLRTPQTKDINGEQTLSIYPVFAFGKNSTLLKYAAINGGFTDFNGNNLPDLQAEWDADGDNEPDNYFEASEGYSLENELLRALTDILNRASSGVASSVLASTGEGEGAVYQALFVPGETDNATEANWRGYVQGFFVDRYGNIREDSNLNDRLDYKIDNIVEMFYDEGQNTTKVKLYRDANGDGQPDGALTIKALEDIRPIWEGGKILWAKSASNRQIYTTINGYSFSGLNVHKDKGSFHDGNDSELGPYLRADTDAEAANIINYIRGDNIAGYRTRSFTINGSTSNWKLGDIIYSTPSLVAAPAENFDLLYGDSTYSAFRRQYADRRHMLYVGANDGMLHAFNAGVFDPDKLNFSGSGYTLGDELWAFIPRELLPHLKWLADPHYTHVYYVDLKPKIVDARIFNPDLTHPNGWGTILIGGMRYGGKEICATDDFGSGNETKTFRSSYFALDVTNPEQPPTLLWTFTHDSLPLTTSYPAVLRVGSRGTTGTWFALFGSGPTGYEGSSTQRGKIFAVKISDGADGEISSWTAGTNYWESGVDFLTGGINATLDDYAFMADPITLDIGSDYQVDVAYIGNNYCDKPISDKNPSLCSSSNWKGKMYRITTKTGAGSQPSTNPEDWTLSVLFDPVAARSVNRDIVHGPISTAPSAAMDKRGNLWLFFGLGRFWHTNDKALDCPRGKCKNWAFFGIKDTCRPWFDPTCTSDVTDLYNSTSVDVCGSIAGDPTKQGGQYTTCVPLYGTARLWSDILSNSLSKNGWYLNFPPPGDLDGEKVLSKPLVLGGLVTWATYTSNPSDLCAFEGTSKVYATYYTTGTAYREYTFEQLEGTVERKVDLGMGAPSSVGAAITGNNSMVGFMQQSTGAIRQIGEITPLGLRSRLMGWKSEGCE